MQARKSYSVGETVWIYGIDSKNNLPTAAKIIKILDLTDVGHSNGPFYIVEIPTHVDPLLEIRTWETISQDSMGPVGALRNLGNLNPTNKMLSKAGYNYSESDSLESDGPSPEQIQAALEQSISNTVHTPLILKETKSYNRRKSSRERTRK